MTGTRPRPGVGTGATGNGLDGQGQGIAPLTSVNGQVPDLDLDAVREALAPYRGAAGLISVVSAPDTWSGREFPTSLAGLEQAVQYVRDLDAQCAEGIYLRGTTVRAIAAGRGGADDSVVWLRFQLDLDHGKTGYAPDAETVRELVDATGLPEPSRWINSGHGLYPQWWLDKPCEDSPAVRALARDIEAVVAAEFTRRGYKIDSTSDAARPWRIPGTVNRKREPFVPCRVLETSGRAYSLAELRAAVPSSTRAETNGSGPKQAQRRPFTLADVRAFITEPARTFTGSTEGGQNNAANGLSFAMGHFITTDDHPGHWTRQEAEEWVWEAGEECGYAQRDPSGLRATIRSGLDAGMRDC